MSQAREAAQRTVTAALNITAREHVDPSEQQYLVGVLVVVARAVLGEDTANRLLLLDG